MPVPVEFSLVTNADVSEELQFEISAPVLVIYGEQTVWYAPVVVGKSGEFV